MATGKSLALAATAVIAGMLAGCASRIPAGSPAYVYVADNGVVTFRGETLRSREVPARLLKAGAKPSTHIYIVSQGDVPTGFLSEIATECGKAGLPNCTIRERMKISIEKASEAQVQNLDASQRNEGPTVRIKDSRR